MKFINKKLFLFLIFSLFFITGFLLFHNFVQAQTSSLDVGLKEVAATGLPSGDIRTIVAKIIKAALGLLGIVALCLMLYAGYLWMTAGGDDEKVGTAKKILINATVGLAIILSSYAIVSYVMNKLVEATGGGGDTACQIQKNTGGLSCGGQCPACVIPPCPYGNCDGNFKIVQMPATGNVCIQNVAPVIVFNMDVDISTLKDKIVVEDTLTSVPVVGDWSWQTNYHKIAYFKPTTGVCPAPDVGKDCFAAVTSYKIKIKNGGVGIQNTDGKDLNCALSTGKCLDVIFFTGDGVDRKNPTISISYPKITDVDLKQGNDISAKINFTDDGGLQNMLLNVDGILVESKNFVGCQKSGTATIVWPTSKLNIGDHSLKAIGLDWAANTGEDNSVANLKPAYCFNKVLDLDKGEKFIDCGGVCGMCSGDKCAKDADCASGFCQKQNPNDPEGVCVDKTYISDFSPASAAIGDFVSVMGKNFGVNKGHVYFAKVPNPDIKKLLVDWVEAQVVDCGPGFNNWSDNQIIVLVPDGAISDKIAVFNAKAVGVDNFNVKYFDTTGDGFKKVPNFILSNISHPGICGLLPNSGSVGTNFSAKGKNFGVYDIVKSSIVFGDNTKAKIVGGVAGWADTLILSVVPVTLGNGDYGVKVTNNSNQFSNTILFKVSGVNPDAPFITDISSPATTTIGDYLTLTGKNFGDQPGAVWFKPSGVLNVVGENGNLIFPLACKNSFWKDNQIIVKVPVGLDNKNKKYTIQVYNITNELNSVLDDNKSVVVNVGDPSPGICGISPVSGPVPFAAGKFVAVSGEYLDKVTNFYFWKLGGKTDDITKTLISSNVSIIDDKTVTTTPNNKDIISGLAFAYRATDKKQSNGVLFSASDCTKNNNTCTDASLKCCTVGADLGSCKPKGDLCIGEFKNSGFVWMFSTKEIIPPPQVVERCDAQTELGIKFPSPSPSTKWNVLGKNDADKVCQTALVTVEFSSNLDKSTINDKTVLVYSCDSIDIKGVCQKPQLITLTLDSYILNFASLNQVQNVQPFLSIKNGSVAGKWDENKIYQVVLKDSIAAPVNKGQTLKLMATNPCGAGTAYCFSFKTGKGDCALKQVVVTPYEFWAKLLESPMHYHSTGGDVFDVYYKGNGLSDQYCIMMDVSGFDWKWTVDNKNPPNPLKPYVTLNGVDNKISTQVNTLGNTVGIGVPNESVDVKATASTSTPKVSKTGSSPLTVDLSNPDVVDYWPNCLEACTNAAVGAKFNVTMSNHNIGANSPAIKLVQCNDENCLSTSQPINLSTGKPIDLNSIFNAGSGNTILQIANYGPDAGLLPNKLYQVTLSTSSTPPAKDSIDQLWSAANSTDFNTFSKPYNKAFTWRFRTKKEACKVDHIDVVPKVFVASKLKDLAVFQSQPYAAPDACSKTGQKLNPWTQNWDWTSSDLLVATVTTFKTKGSGAYCTANCILKGSTVPAGAKIASYPICGNGKIEAGEDCDDPSKATGCGLNCKFLGNLDKITCGNGVIDNTKGEACDIKDPKSSVGCSDICLHTGSKMQTAAKEISASICGNSMVGMGEDCDLGVPADQNVPISSMYCSEQCLHFGTRLSSQWCFDHSATANPAYGGFDQKDYNFYCSQAYSQCGDGVQSPDEDKDCDLGKGKYADWCNDRCLKIDKTKPDITSGVICAVAAEGCNDNLQHVGSSLLYSVPSVCGDGTPGIGEDAICETDQFLTNLWHKDSNGFLVDPWVLAIGQAGSVKNVVSTTIPVQVSDIKGTTAGISGVGKYQVLCGYKTDEDCQAAYAGDKNIGVGANSCCYFKTKLTGVYPGNTSTIPAKYTTNVCINTYIEADFDSVIDPATLPGNFIIARSAASACTGGLEDVSSTISFLDSFDSSLPWYKNIWNKIIIVIKNIFGHEVSANAWCAGADLGQVQVVPDNKGGSKVLFGLVNPLAKLTDYVVILKKGIKNIQGVGIESKPDGKAINWKFKTGEKICEIEKVTIDPDQHYFSKLNENVILIAKGMAAFDQIIQPVNGYSWIYQWGPKSSPSVLISSTSLFVNVVIPQNNNGEVDVHASAVITENLYTNQTGIAGTGKSHIIVFLCENPWPPKEVLVPGQVDPAIIFPYEDKIGNNDGFDLANNIFDNTAIPAAKIGKGYFNFSTYYCADNGDTGIIDDLPYLRPAVQGVGKTCQVNPTVPCETDQDCSFGDITMNGVTFPKVKKGYCIAYDPIQFSSSPYTMYNAASVPSFLQCNYDSDCSADSGYFNWFNKYFSNSGYKTTCQSLDWFNLPTSKCLSGSGEISGFKRFLFTNDKNNDAIGIQVLANPKHLSPSDWLYSEFAEKGFQDLPPIDGNKAISVGSNIYVGALNFDNVPNGNLFTNIYLFSINDNAAPETKKVFDSLLKNLKFNINLTNYGYCGKDMNNPGDTDKCVSDFDCPSGEVCSVQKDKLLRNFSRIQDMGSMDKSLSKYFAYNKSTYPDLKEGTYLSGQTISTWPSWSKLGNATGGSMPTDPINKLGVAGTCASTTGKFCISDADCSKLIPPETCVLHAPDTGWSTADKRYSFACANDSLAYRYIATSTSPTSSDYLVKLRLEDPGLVINNFYIPNSPSLVTDLIDNPEHFNFTDPNGICNQKNEITTINQGTCGDGKINLNKGELCDPPGGGVVWDTTKCNAQGSTSSTPLSGTMCSDDCKTLVPTTTKCGILSKCGNGKVEVGEKCDDGALNNGKYNHCNLTCTGLAASCGDGVVSSAFESCDIADGYAGWCVGGVNDNHYCAADPVYCNTTNPATWDSTNGKCISLAMNKNKYGSSADFSCAFDCQKAGPYCGDGFVQAEFGEECDGSQTCSIGNANGQRICKQCRWQNQSAIVYYKFDDVWVKYPTSSIPNFATSTNLMAYCNGKANAGCPAVATSADASKKQAMYFNGSSNYFTIDSNPSFNLNEITFATWVNVDTTTAPGWHAILSKQSPSGAANTRDFNFYIITSGTPAVVSNFHLFSMKSNDYIFGVNNATPGTSTIFSGGSWHFVALTVNAARTVSYYVDGKLLSNAYLGTKGNPAIKADSSYPIWIGRADNWFKGSMDEMHLFGRALSTAEIDDLYKNGKNFCEAKIAPIAEVKPVVIGDCGNGKVDADEICDNGAKNGVPCIPGYNKDCTYCLEGCKNTAQVKAKEYCGDGVINGPEVCDVDNNTVVNGNGLIYSSTTSTYNVSIADLNQWFLSKNVVHNGYEVAQCYQEYNLKLNAGSISLFNGGVNPSTNLITQIGTKSCINNCTSISNQCIECGQKVDGAIVSGNMINVLSPKSNNPLMASPGVNGVWGTIGLAYSEKGKAPIPEKDTVAYYYDFKGENSNQQFLLKTAPYNNPDNWSTSTINGDQICSDSTQPRSYRLSLNADLQVNHLLDFQVATGKYNLILSPVIMFNPATEPPKNYIRMVISWVGDVWFQAGFIIPGQGTLEDLSLSSDTGTDFDVLNPKNDIWYHGYGSTDDYSVTEKSFTVSTYNMATSAYAFYVRTENNTNKSMYNFKNSAKLKVDVYMPGSDGNTRHFDRPVKTFYLTQALSSDNNDSAQYWHVFNVKQPPVAGLVAAGLSTSIEEINRIRTFIKMDYTK